MTRHGSRGWHVEVVHPSTGNVLRPQLKDGAKREPSANDYPRVHVPVRKSDKWNHPDFEGATMKAWLHGTRLPVDEIDKVQQEPGKTVLVGKGGIELEKRARAEYDFSTIHDAADGLIDTVTSYASNVDAPSGSTTQNKTVQSGDTDSELSGHFRTTDATNPIRTDGNGNLVCAQTGFWLEAEDAGDAFASASQDQGPSTEPSGPDTDNTSQNNVRNMFSESHYIEWTFTLDYEIPASEVILSWRGRLPTGSSGSGPGLRWSIDGDNSFGTDTGGGFSPIDDEYFKQDSVGGNTTLSAGSHTVRVDVYDDLSGSADNVYIDLAFVGDARYHQTSIDNSTTYSSNTQENYLDRPSSYPDGNGGNVPVREFEDAETIEAVTGGRIELTNINDQTNAFEVGLTNEQGQNYATSGSVPFETDFADVGPTVNWRVTLGGYGTQEVTPSQSPNGQQFDAFTLKADTEDTPLLIDQSFDGPLMTVLREMADQGDFVFEVRRDGGSYSVEWTQPGQRSASQEPDVSRYRATKDPPKSISKVVVKGSSQHVDGEDVTANHGTWVDLNETELRETREVVRDGSGTTYSRGDDYEMEYLDGRIKTLSGGAISDGASILVDYDHRVVDSYTNTGASGTTREVVRDIPALTTTRGCGVAARRIFDEVSDVGREGVIVLSADDPNWSLVESLDPEELPTNGEELHLKDLSGQPGKVKIKLGDHRDTSELVTQINQHVSMLDRRV